MLLKRLPSGLLTFLWSGTWSFVRPPFLSLVPLVIAALLLAAGLLWRARRVGLKNLEWTALLMLAILLVGLMQQSLVYMASGSAPAIPGWYLHSYAPALAPLVGAGLATLMLWPPLRAATKALMFYLCGFLPAALGVNWLFYAGCGTRQLGLIYYDFSTLSCATDIPAILDRLALLGFPLPAISLLAIGWGLMLCGVGMAVAVLNGASRRPNP